MYIKSIKIVNFRNFKEKVIEFPRKITVILGNNAVGKTSIVEAVNCLSSIKSFRTNDNKELINYSEDFFYLEGILESDSGLNKVSFYFDKTLKKVKLNNFVFSRLSEYLGFFNVVCFSALDFLKLSGTSSERRKLFDLIFCQISKDYLVLCNYYKKFLKDRNTLLKRLSFENRDDLQKLLQVVTEQLCTYGNKIIEYRKELIVKISSFAKIVHHKISNELEDFELVYYPCSSLLNLKEYDSCYLDDLRKGYTTKGPHKDDYIFIINNKNVATYGSQGQQKNAMLSVRLAMADLIYETKKEAPTLLLDDVFSELDKQRQNALINSLNPDYQTIITTASVSDLDRRIIDNALVVELNKRSE